MALYGTTARKVVRPFGRLHMAMAWRCVLSCLPARSGFLTPQACRYMLWLIYLLTKEPDYPYNSNRN